MSNIHTTAVIEDGAVLGAEVEVGPYSVIGQNVTIGDGVRIKSHVVIDGHTTLGGLSVVHPFAAIGQPPQDLKYDGEDTKLKIGEKTVVREHVTLHPGTAVGRGETVIGDNCMFMAGSHVAHDSIIGDHVIFANHAAIGGHVVIGDFVFLGGLSAVHQFSRIGAYAFVGGMAALENDLIPYGSCKSNRAYLSGLNIIGMKRRNMTREAIHNLRCYGAVFRLRRDHGHCEFHPRLLVSFDLSAAAKPISIVTDPLSDSIGKVGIIAGGGDLPLRLARACQSIGRPYLVLGIEGWAGEDIVEYEHVWITLGGIGRTYRALENAACKSVVIAGYVKRPDFSKLKLDMTGTKLLPKVIKAARKGDDALLTVLVEAMESQGFNVVGAEEIFADLLASDGLLGLHQPTSQNSSDIVKAQEVIDALGPYDIGQAAIVCNEHVLTIEAAEGTDDMLRRCLDLPKEIRGTPEERAGVLVKVPKTGQERRVDLPTIGLRTIEMADEAGLAGIALAAGAALILDRDDVIAAADRAGLFILGIQPAETRK
jgi:acyl-ACP--UDP-N-acetylglucosamine O-acyltransferase